MLNPADGLKPDGKEAHRTSLGGRLGWRIGVLAALWRFFAILEFAVSNGYRAFLFYWKHQQPFGLAPVCLVIGHTENLLGMPYDETSAVLALVIGAIVTGAWYYGKGGMADHYNWDGSIRVKRRTASKASMRESLAWHYAPSARCKARGTLLLVAALPVGCWIAYRTNSELKGTLACFAIALAGCVPLMTPPGTWKLFRIDLKAGSTAIGAGKTHALAEAAPEGPQEPKSQRSPGRSQTDYPAG